MRMFTFAVLAAAFFCSSNCDAQIKRGRIDFMKAVCNAQKSAPVKMKNSLVKRSPMKAEVTGLWRPAHEKEYLYEEGDWVDYGDYSYKYNPQGYILETLYDDGETKDLLSNVLNENNLVTDQVEQIAEDGVNYVNYLRRTAEYDPQLTDLITNKTTYMWYNDAWDMNQGTYSYKRTITRNDAGNVTSVVIASYYDGAYEDLQRQTITYDETTGKAVTYKLEVLADVDSWETSVYLKNIEWDRTNGQLGKEYTEWFQGDNRLKKADMVLEYGDTELTYATLTVDYQDNGSFTLIMDGTAMASFGGTAAYQKDVMTYTDENGSYEYTTTYYEDANGDVAFTDDEVADEAKVIEMYDSHGNETQYKEYMLDEETGELTLDAASKYEYEYDEATDARKTETYYELSDAATETYEPYMKIVADEFVDVTASISNAVTMNADNASAVYNLQGVKVGVSTENLPAGLYIVKANSKTVKMIKK